MKVPETYRPAIAARPDCCKLALYIILDDAAVCTCATAAKALEQLRDKTHNFDLVLSDVYMPGECWPGPFK